jgi:hypothetical protein
MEGMLEGFTKKRKNKQKNNKKLNPQEVKQKRGARSTGYIQS